MTTAQKKIRYFHGKSFLATASLCVLLAGAAQAQYWNWTWMKGSDTRNQNGTYGTVLNEGSTNTPGGRRYAVAWVDNSDNFWVFGGDGYPATGTTNDNLNDLWKYNPASGNWTWMKGSNGTGQWGTYGSIGVAASGNTPGARDLSTSWADSSGNLWLFGGTGWNSSGSSGRLNDLWKYDISTGNWTWMKGSQSISQVSTYGSLGIENSANTPGGRTHAVGWTDADDNLWLFGGSGNVSAGTGNLNDLWKYNTVSGNWTWMKGSSDRNQVATYGAQGTEAVGNTPGGRTSSTGWADDDGNLWLFGGYGNYSSSASGYLQELWKYDIGSGSWTWMKGSNSPNQRGIYGTQGTAASANTPGCRNHGQGWIDSSGDLWLFGGMGYDSTGLGTGAMNDVWQYDVVANNWTWIKGSNLYKQGGTYGTILNEDPGNTPGGRANLFSGLDSNGTFWLLGGFGYDDAGSYGMMNDLWKFESSSLPVELDYFMID